MEITGTSSLWKDYDITTLPFNTSALSDKTVDGVRVKELYFDGFTTVDGRVRTYIKILEQAEAKGVILYMADFDCDNDNDTVKSLYDMGYTVAMLDYLGERDSSARYTLYPKSLSRCKCYNKREFHALSDALCSRWYIWTCIARKTVKLLRETYPEQKLFALGKGLGGSTVYKLASFDDGLTAAATLLNVLPDVTGTGNPLLVYQAALDNSAYAPITKVPLFMAVASNDKDKSFDDMSELAESTVSLEGFRVIERAFADSINIALPQVKEYFDSYLSNPKSIPEINVKAVNSEGKLYFNINIDNESGAEIESVELFAAFCVENPTHRNWTNIATLKLGNNEYIANVVVLQADKPVYAFVNATLANGCVSSSRLVKILPKSMGIASQPIKYRRVIYDANMGKDVWTSRGGGKIELKNGPFEICGVTSSTNSLISFKPSDVLYRTDSDSILQIIISGKPQTVRIELTEEEEQHYCEFEIPEGESWHKITLSLRDFKGTNPLTEWNNITVLEFKATDEIIISSVLWV